jgi:hypothetical protein
MLGAKRRIASLVPERRLVVEFAARRVQQRRIGAVADQRVREHHFIAMVVATQQIARDRHRRNVAGIADQMAKQVERKALPDNGSRLER